jgi:twitching motility protein PilJ
MAFKLPSVFKSADKKVSAPSASATASKAAPPPKAAAAKAAKPAGPSFWDKLTGKKPKVTSSLTQTAATPKPPQTTTGPSTNSGFGATGDQTRKISAAIAANKVSKPKAEKGPFKLPIIGKYATVTQFQVLGTIAGLCFALMAAAIGLYFKKNADLAAYTNITSTLQFHTQRLAKSGGQAARGDVRAFAELQDSRDQFQFYLDTLNDGGPAFGVNVPSAKNIEAVATLLVDLTQRNLTASASSTAILAAKDDLTNLARNVAQTRAGSEELAGLSQQLTVFLQQSGANPAQVLKVNRLTFLSERLGRGAAEILGAEAIDSELTFQMGKDTNDFKDLVKALETGSDAIGISAVTSADGRARVVKLREAFTTFEGNIKPILDNVQKLVSARRSAGQLNDSSGTMLTNVEQMQGSIAAERSLTPLIFAGFFFALMLVFLGLMAMLYLANERKRAIESEAENKRNQEAILRLLNEMGDLADGDLTIRAKVTEDITGAIADSMNYTIDELRTLVTGVNNASTQVSAKSQQAQAVSVQLLDAAEKQSREIQDTTDQVLQVANTLTNVSDSAAESSKVAMRSLAAADKGRLAVQNSISGMNDIREQIQETSKRIKRLGESSQEIGEIVELISDITEQTNVLALNAAIQAASAGEAGRGFSVVAEEVQRLAERSAEATKQIGAIVKTIQADTQDAVAAMEKSTTGVVEGAKLSDAAGQALTEIDSVTKNLASLIQQISSDTQTQAASASKVAQNMQDILEINRQTTSGTQQTASSIKELADVASDLKASVSGFKL